jgi:transcriptional regulator of arginine metabolism
MLNNQPSGTAGRRRAEIVRLVARRRVRSQETLQRLLRGRGFAVAQPTLSRDVAALGLARTPTGYAAPADAAAFVSGKRRAASLDRVLRQAGLSARAAGTLVVLRTGAAGANPVARAIDEAALPGVLGSIAGDDTVFVATTDRAAARRVARRLVAPMTTTRPSRRSRV